MSKALWVAAMGFLFLLGGCADSPEKVTSEFIDVIDDMNDILDGVKTSSDAERAKPGLEKIAGRLKALATRVKEMSKPTDDQVAAAKKLESKLEAQKTRFEKNMGRLSSDPAIFATLSGPMQNILMAVGEISLAAMDNDAVRPPVRR